MAQQVFFDAETVKLNTIFNNGVRLRVPEYQRDYSWDEEQWEDLWLDILALKDQTSRVHYLGAIVLQNKDNKSYSLIDGQQRLATLSIIALAVIKRIQDLIDSELDIEANNLRKETLLRQYIGDINVITLNYSNKLDLNENNDSFYRSFIAKLKEPINEHRLSVSNKLLIKAFRYFYKAINELLGDKPTGQALTHFLQNQVAEKLLFIRIEVENEVDAYTIFETLNSRGIELSISDLLKNYILSLSHSPEAKEQWHRIIQITDLEDFPVFLNHYWNSRFSYTRKEKLFKALRDTVNSPEKAFDLLDELEKSAAVHSALKEPGDELWKGNKQIKNRIAELSLFNATQPFPLLLVSYEKLRSEFEQILRFCSIIAFRYNIIGGLNPNKQEQVFHAVAKKVFEGKITTASQIAQELKEIYPGDEDFMNAFKTKQLNTKSKKKLARYILYSIENQIAGTDRNFEDETATIEHILPENPPLEWESSFSLEEQENYIYRLGNLTLLESAKNNDCGTKPFEEKQIIYQQSQYQMTKQIDYPEWTASQVRSRQENLANIAKTVWKISQISN